MITLIAKCHAATGSAITTLLLMRIAYWMPKATAPATDAVGGAARGRPGRTAAAQLDRADPALGLRQLVDRAKSRGQRQLRALEDGARGEARLVLAGIALDLLATLNLQVLSTTAPLIGETSLSAYLEPHRRALLFGLEPRPKRRLAHPPRHFDLAHPFKPPQRDLLTFLARQIPVPDSTQDATLHAISAH